MIFSKGIVIGLTLLVAATYAIAQSNNEALEHELNQLYQKQLAAEKMIHDQQSVKAEAPAVVAPVAPSVTVNQVNVAPAAATAVSVDENTAAPAAVSTVKELPSVHQSPAVNIEASPLAPSRADQLRKARQDQESHTEQSIVEQLEASRLESERKRSEALLKNMQKVEAPVVEAAPPAVQVVPVGSVAPAQVTTVPAQAPANPNPEIVQMKEEIKSIAADVKAQNDKPKTDHYFSFGIGLPDYKNVYNLKSDASFGLGFGFKSPNNIVFEGSLYYSLLRIERPTTAPWGIPEIDNVDQYNGIAAIKYMFFTGKVRPLVGALASYTYREYTCGQFWVCNGKAYSYGLDTGVLVGGEVQVSDTFSIALEYQYLRNMSYRTSSVQTSMFFNMNPVGRLEDQEYSMFTIRGRVSF